MLTIAELKEKLVGKGFMFARMNEFMRETMDADSALNSDAAETAMETGNFVFIIDADEYERETGEEGQGGILVEFTSDPECMDGDDFGLDITDVSWC